MMLLLLVLALVALLLLLALAQAEGAARWWLVASVPMVVALLNISSPLLAGVLVLAYLAAGLVLWKDTLAYALFEIPTGYLGDRHGPRRVLLRIVSRYLPRPHTTPNLPRPFASHRLRAISFSLNLWRFFALGDGSIRSMIYSL